MGLLFTSLAACLFINYNNVLKFVYVQKTLLKNLRNLDALYCLLSIYKVIDVARIMLSYVRDIVCQIGKEGGCNELEMDSVNYFGDARSAAYEQFCRCIRR